MTSYQHTVLNAFYIFSCILCSALYIRSKNAHFMRYMHFVAKCTQVIVNEQGSVDPEMPFAHEMISVH